MQLSSADALSWTLGALGRDDDCREFLCGLVSEKISTAHFVIVYSPPAAELCFHAFGHLGEHDVFQPVGQHGGTLSKDARDDWSALLEEGTANWGAGFDPVLGSDVRWDLTASISDAKASVDPETPVGGSPSRADDADNCEDVELSRLSARAGDRTTEHVAFGLFVRRETYEIESCIPVGVVPHLLQSILLAASDGGDEADLFLFQLASRLLVVAFHRTGERRAGVGTRGVGRPLLADRADLSSAHAPSPPFRVGSSHLLMIPGSRPLGCRGRTASGVS